MKLKLKKIKGEGKYILHRLALYLKDGSSFKLHLILNDDIEEPHTHPWDFKSLLLIPYVEEVYHKNHFGGINLLMTVKHSMFSVVKRHHNQIHRVRNYRVLGINIPSITIGRYSKKLQLCSFCKEAGYCKENNLL